VLCTVCLISGLFAANHRADQAINDSPVENTNGSQQVANKSTSRRHLALHYSVSCFAMFGDNSVPDQLVRDLAANDTSCRNIGLNESLSIDCFFGETLSSIPYCTNNVTQCPSKLLHVQG
jgi:hypothetical protein